MTRTLWRLRVFGAASLPCFHSFSPYHSSQRAEKRSKCTRRQPDSSMATTWPTNHWPRWSSASTRVPTRTPSKSPGKSADSAAAAPSSSDASASAYAPPVARFDGRLPAVADGGASDFS